MPFGAHETMEVHEILNEKLNMIQHFALYAAQCQDPQLRQMIDRHRQTAIQSYDQLVNYTHSYQAAYGGPRPYGMPNVQPQQIQYGLRNPADHVPQQQDRLNDQQIVMAVLLCHKNSARNQMMAALECADPNVRQMLLNGALTCANQAYEVFLYMNQQGQYQVPTLNDHTAKTFLHTYKPVNAFQPNQGPQPMYTSQMTQEPAGMPGNMNAPQIPQ